MGVEQLREIAVAVGQRPDLWQEQLHQTTADRTYVDVFTNDHLGVWAISWMADGHDTGYHDHDTSRGAVYVAQGVIRHEHLRLADTPVGEPVPAGQTFAFDATVIHRMRREHGAGRTVTVHAYSPPLERTGQYTEDDDALHRRSAPSQEQLRPRGSQGPPTDAVG